MRYQPRLKNGKLAKLSWPVALYRRFNPLVWPMEDNPSAKDIYMERLVLIFGFLVICMHLEADIHYLWANVKDMDKLLTGVPTFLLQLEMLTRSLQLSMKKDRLKKLLQHFYAEVYMKQESKYTQTSDFKRIEKLMLGPRYATIFYLITLMSFFYEPGKSILEGRRELIYKQAYYFDYTKLPVYLPLLCLSFWIGILVSTVLFGELNMLEEIMVHLNERYLELGRDLRRTSQSLLELKDHKNIATKYHQALIKLLRRNVSLNNFAEQVENQFTFRIFVTFSISAIILCSLGFACYTDPLNNIVNIMWLLSKFLELLAFGFLGSVLYETTNELDLMYYTSDWEQIVYQSNNFRENVRLMKLIILSIELNLRPFALTGLKYFRVTLAAVVKILQGAFSYFTFLTSMR